MRHPNGQENDDQELQHHFFHIERLDLEVSVIRTCLGAGQLLSSLGTAGRHVDKYRMGATCTCSGPRPTSPRLASGETTACWAMECGSGVWAKEAKNATCGFGWGLCCWETLFSRHLQAKRNNGRIARIPVFFHIWRAPALAPSLG